MPVRVDVDMTQSLHVNPNAMLKLKGNACSRLLHSLKKGKGGGGGAVIKLNLLLLEKCCAAESTCPWALRSVER